MWTCPSQIPYPGHQEQNSTAEFLSPQVGWENISLLPSAQRRDLLLLFSSSVVSNSLQPISCCTPGLPVLHHLPEFAQIHVHWVGDAIHHLTLCDPLSSCPQSFQASRSFPLNRVFTSGGQNIGASASASLLPKNIQGWFPIVLTGLISLLPKGFSRVFFSTTV